MKTQTKTLLAGVAALALMAGTGLASAEEQKPAKQPQTSTQPMKSGAVPSAQQTGASHMGQQQGASHVGQNAQPSGHKMGMEQPARRGKSAAQQPAKGMERFGRSTSPKGVNTTTKRQQAEQINRGKKGNFERSGTTQTEQRGSVTTRGTRTTGTSITEHRTGRSGVQGLQGNASGTHVTLSDEQRTRIRQRVIGAHGAPRVSHVDFDLSVGTVIPRGRIHVVPVPSMLVNIEPGWRGFLYFIYEDELVIVDPNDMRIVAVLAV
jgi:Protein of unknown function (DUF1236)